MLAEASFAIVVCGDKKIEEVESYLLQNCSAATQNILLAAHSYGLGATWLGIHPREDRINAIKEVLNMSEDIFPVSMIAVGYPGEEKLPEDRFLQDRIKYID
jgi:nitroreductase